jgi:hypothetical protein
MNTETKKLIHDLASPVMILGIISQSLEENLSYLLEGYEQALKAGLISTEKKIADFELFKELLAQNGGAVNRMDQIVKKFRATL